MAMSSVSVVTNALRLRSFRVPDSPEEILHPPLSGRVREYGYLAGIAVLAVVVGARRSSLPIRRTKRLSRCRTTPDRSRFC